MTDRVTVMIVDDQDPFRAAARAVVDRIDGFELVAEVESGEEAVAVSEADAPDLVLMDINMGELDGIAATKLITAAAPRTTSDPGVDVPARGPSARRHGKRRRRLRQQGRAVAPSAASHVGGSDGDRQRGDRRSGDG